VSTAAFPAGADRAREHVVRRGRALAHITIGYNSLEALIAILSGVAAGSVALIGFGLDSLIEVTSGAVALWRLHSDSDLGKRERSERAARRIIGVCFLALSAYVAWEAAESLWLRMAPERSLPGIALACASLVVMPLLARAKRKVALSLGSSALASDSKQTEFCTYLSAILLGGLLLNAMWSWWWADPIAGLVMTPVIAREGVVAMRGRSCGCH
jgi:divalent metal cation (Fe/Co/Zn/Cd) transporter